MGAESQISKSISKIDVKLVPFAALVTIVIKGIKFTAAECILAEDGRQRRLIGSLSLIEAVMPDVKETRKFRDSRASDDEDEELPSKATIVRN